MMRIMEALFLAMAACLLGMLISLMVSAYSPALGYIWKSHALENKWGRVINCGVDIRCE